MRTIRPRGTGAAPGAAAFAARWGLLVAPAPAMRVPQAPQNANPGATIRPQVGQGVPSAEEPREVDAPVAAGGRVDQAAGSTAAALTGGGVGPPPRNPDADALAAAVPAADAPPFCKVGAAIGVGILGESFHGMPPFCLDAAGTGATTVAGNGVGSLPCKCPCDVRSGGTIVRAVSSGAGSRAADLGAGLISLPQPRQNL